MVVVLLLAAIWATVFVPPAVRAHNARRQAFEVSFGRSVAPDSPPLSAASGRHSPAVQRRRRIAGGLLVAMLATGGAGLVPTFRILLVVHLFVVDSFLFYVALLAHRSDRLAALRRGTAGTGVLADVPPVAAAS